MSALPADKVVADGDCLLWTGALNSKGYGCVTDGSGRSMLAHRKAYELAFGPIPDGLEIDHLCRRITCVRPEHLEAVTGEENARRRWATYTTCRRGHALVGSNVRVHRRTNGRTSQECRTCARAQQSRYRNAA